MRECLLYVHILAIRPRPFNKLFDGTVAVQKGGRGGEADSKRVTTVARCMICRLASLIAACRFMQISAETLLAAAISARTLPYKAKWWQTVCRHDS